MNCKISIIASLMLASLLCSSSYADMIQNGSFESASGDPGSSFYPLFNGYTSITDWTVIGGGIDYIGGYWKASDGSRSLDLNASTPGGIEQTINTVKGNTYKVTFDLAGNFHLSPTTKEMNVKAIGVTTQTELFSFDTTNHNANNMGWVTESWTFTADSTITKLQFLSATSGAAGPALDNVRVEAMSVVPVPGAFLLGLIGMGLAGIKTRKSL